LALTSGTDIECFGSNGPSNLNVAFAGASGNSSEEFEDPPPTHSSPRPLPIYSVGINKLEIRSCAIM